MVKRAAEKDPQNAALYRLAISAPSTRHVIAWHAAEHGEWCGFCAEDLGGEVFRQFVPFASRVVPVCADCCWIRESFRSIGRCSCGALVHCYRWSRRRWQFVACCNDHRTDQVNAARRERRAWRRIRRCQSCQKQWTANRNDARYCSPACRQKAYRTRKAATS